MRVMLVAVIAVVSGCMASEPVMQSPPDAGVDAIFEGSINARVGEACSTDPTPWCGGGTAWCWEGVCRSFCSPPYLPPVCPTGSSEHHSTSGPLACVCVPD